MPPPPEPFAAFMARALFDPERGYYSRRIRTVGARGDFSTSATLSPMLGRTVAGWLSAESRAAPEVYDVIEVGGGDGSLMAELRRALGFWTRHRFRFHLIETSAVLRERQQQRLGRRVVTWHEDLSAALQGSGGRAFIFHNELLDAFPVTLIQWDAGTANWQEVCLVTQPGGPTEHLRPFLLDSGVAARFSALQHWTADSPPPYRQQRCELHLSLLQWLQDWAPHWQAGAMLTIDYGDEFPELYRRRPNGTLRAYLQQQRLEGADVYANAGRQDITADVNFTDLRAWGRDLGWLEQAYGTQAELIRTYLNTQPRGAVDARLLDPQGAGAAFKYLIHRRR